MSGAKTSPPHIVIASTRRSWSREQKRAILAETGEPGTTISEVARRHGVRPSLLFRWRRDILDEERAASQPPQPAFVPLLLPSPANAAPVERAASSIIEIELAGGHRLRADASVDVTLLCRVIEALVGR
jgi:transposase